MLYLGECYWYAWFWMQLLWGQLRKLLLLLLNRQQSFFDFSCSHNDSTIILLDCLLTLQSGTCNLT